MEERFEIGFPEKFTCLVCEEAKLPYTMMVPCGHSFCEECTQQSAECPECGEEIISKNVNDQMTEVVSAAAVYSCRECDWSGKSDAAQKHRCDLLYLRFCELVPNLDPDVFDAALDPFRQIPLDLVQDEEVLEVLLKRSKEQSEQEEQLSYYRRGAKQPPSGAASSASGTGHSLATTAPATAGGGGNAAPARTVIFWDYDNINQSKCGRGVSTTIFVKKILDFLKERGIMSNKIYDGHAYFVNGVTYPDNVVEQCSKLQFQRYLCSKKREAADRELQRKLRDVAKERQQQRNDSRIVLISDDGDFIETVKEVRDQYQCHVHVIHHASGDHLFHLQAHAASTIDIKEIFPHFMDRLISPVQAAPHAQTKIERKSGRHPEHPPTVLVEGKPQLVGSLVHNQQVQFLLSRPTVSGKWCAQKPLAGKIHDPLKCKFVHKKTAAPTATTTVNVDGQQVALAHLVPNQAFEYLLANPGRQRSFCTRPVTQHDPETCKFVHRITARGSTQAQGQQPEQPQRPRPQQRGGGAQKTHPPSDSGTKKKTCHTCHQPGHFARECPCSTEQAPHGSQQHQQGGRGGAQHGRQQQRDPTEGGSGAKLEREPQQQRSNHSHARGQVTCSVHGAKRLPHEVMPRSGGGFTCFPEDPCLQAPPNGHTAPSGWHLNRSQQELKEENIQADRAEDPPLAIPGDNELNALSVRELLALLGQHELVLHEIASLGVTERSKLIELARKKRNAIRGFHTDDRSGLVSTPPPRGGGVRESDEYMARRLAEEEYSLAEEEYSLAEE